MARKARTWKGARTPQALKRVRQATRRHAINQRTRSNARTLVQRAASIALGRSEGDGGEGEGHQESASPMRISSAWTAFCRRRSSGTSPDRKALPWLQ